MNSMFSILPFARYIMATPSPVAIDGLVVVRYTWPFPPVDRQSTRLNYSHTEIYTLSLHDALPIFHVFYSPFCPVHHGYAITGSYRRIGGSTVHLAISTGRSAEHTAELQSHRDLHSFPTRRSSDLPCFLFSLLPGTSWLRHHR